MRNGEARIQLQRLVALLNRLIESPRIVKLLRQVKVHYRGNWVTIEGSFRLAYGFVGPPATAKIKGVRWIIIGHARSRIQREGSLKMLVGSRPIPVVRGADPSQCDVGLCEVVVDFQRLQGCGLPFRPHFPRRKRTREPEASVPVSQSGVSQR